MNDDKNEHMLYKMIKSEYTSQVVFINNFNFPNQDS